MRLRLGLFVSLGCFAAVPVMRVQGQLAPQPKGAKVCLAAVQNFNLTPTVDHLTDRLASSLKQGDINVLVMESRTTGKDPKLSRDNQQEAKEKGCDYVLLSQIRDPQRQRFEPLPPPLPKGGVPSLDAADSTYQGPVYREDLQVVVVLLKMGRTKPMLDTSLLERPSANASETLLLAMDHEAIRVGTELRKH